MDVVLQFKTVVLLLFVNEATGKRLIVVKPENVLFFILGTAGEQAKSGAVTLQK
jgi:hypothetical protein